MSSSDAGRPVDGCGASAALAEPEQQEPVYEGQLLSEIESEYVTRHFAEVRKAAELGPTGHVARRRADVIPLPHLAVGAAVRAVWRSAELTHARAVLGYRARKAPRDLMRLTWFALRGHARWVQMAWTFFTYSDLRRDVRAARLAGDTKARREAQERIRDDSRARWARFGMLVEYVGRSVTVVGVAALLLWLVDSMMPRGEMWPWLAGLYELLAVLQSMAIAVIPIIVGLAPFGWLVAAVHMGRDMTPGTGFLVQPHREDVGGWVDERMISQALAHLGIAPLDKFLKSGGQLVYTLPARIDGNGTYAQIRLPLGVTADMVADRRDRLAANLGRAKLETWPTEGAEAGQLDLWVADKGNLGRGAGAWPLLTGGEVDVFGGVPFGRSQRGEVLTAPILERNYLIGGQPGQGKSSAGRTLCLGCALDPTVELRVYIFAFNPDFDPFRPRLSAYVKGDDDEAIEAGLGELLWLRDEVTRRGKLLERHGAARVTRKLANTVAGLHPVIVVFDECHEMFEHPEFGGEAGSLAIKVIKKARKCGITLIFLTQSPTAASIPKDLARNCSNGVAFAVADHVANDGLLGTGKYRQGIRATELRPGEDRGTAVAVGLTANRFELVNTFYVAFDEDRDDVTPVIERAIALPNENGRTV
ncbi:hypothetical protein ACQPZQ_34100 [Pseudonocardia sp. CA-142604]|uniref:hypothetical protein n=1 Tax=Pseudonocardia sp. CA-142604 TaxID=3240024 RepID=UPI003D8FE30D